MPCSARAIDCSVASRDCSASTPATASMIDSRPRTTRVAETLCMGLPGRSAARRVDVGRWSVCEQHRALTPPVLGATVGGVDGAPAHRLIRASDLKRQRGWTDTLLAALLGAPDALSPNPHGWRVPMRWYREDRV